MTSETQSTEQLLSAERFHRQEARTIKNAGYGQTTGGLALTKRFLPLLASGITERLRGAGLGKMTVKVVLILKSMDPLILAAATLQCALHSIAGEEGMARTANAIGRAVNDEMWADALDQHDAKLAGRIADTVKKKHASVKYRRAAARAIARRAGFTWREGWTKTECLHVGIWLLGALLETLPDVFSTTEDREQQKFLTITEGAWEMAQQACRQAIQARPVFLPCPTPPVPWTDWNKGGPTDPRMQNSATLLRTIHKGETAAAVRAAIADGSMQPALDALNAIQATAWRINPRILAVMLEGIASAFDLPGLPPAEDYPFPTHGEWETMTEVEQKLWKIRAAKTAKANRALVADRVSLEEDLETARQLAECEQFYCPSNMDWRGRVYALTHFNFQREDRVRALFLFSGAEAIGEEGIAWLKVHTANCGDFGKISKKSFDERLQWTDDNLEMIAASAADPLVNVEWMKADKPWLFLAACMELADALRVGPEFCTSLPVSWDGSCSGLQHLSAMTRAAEGQFVNLTDNEQPEDVYQRVAAAVLEAIQEDAVDRSLEGEKVNHARQWLQYGVGRSVVKRNVMTFSYSSNKFGMASQQVEDLMEPLEIEVMKGNFEEHPFGGDNGRSAAKYLAYHVYSCIERIVQKPAQAMGFLQQLARAAAHEGKALRWKTPTGLPWCNRYHESSIRQVALWLSDRGISTRVDVVVAEGHKKEIDKNRASNGVAPNFVHALDAAHLALTVNAGVREGMDAFALVHDSFGCHASRAARFHGIIRETFVTMYEEHDVLAEVLAQAKCDLTERNWHRLPDVVERGPLQLKEVLNAKYAFA